MTTAATTASSAAARISATRAALSAAVMDAHNAWSAASERLLDATYSEYAAARAEQDLARLAFTAALAASDAYTAALGL